MTINSVYRLLFLWHYIYIHTHTRVYTHTYLYTYIHIPSIYTVRDLSSLMGMLCNVVGKIHTVFSSQSFLFTHGRLPLT